MMNLFIFPIDGQAVQQKEKSVGDKEHLQLLYCSVGHCWMASSKLALLFIPI